MVFDYVILPEQRCVVSRFSGSVSPQDVMAGSEKIWSDPAYERSYHVLCDLTRVVIHGTPADVKPLVNFYRRPETSTGLWAAIFSMPNLTALGYLFRAALPVPGRFGIFSSWDGACDYLQISIPQDIFAPIPPAAE